MFAASFLLIFILLFIFVCIPVWVQEIKQYRRNRRNGENGIQNDPQLNAGLIINEPPVVFNEDADGTHRAQNNNMRLEQRRQLEEIL